MGVELDSQMAVSERRMLSKSRTILDSHHRCPTGNDRKPFVPVSIKKVLPMTPELFKLALRCIDCTQYRSPFEHSFLNLAS